MSTRSPQSGQFVVVFSCGPLGVGVANRLVASPGVGRTLLVTAPYRTKRRSVWGLIRHTVRMDGVSGLLGRMLSRATRGMPGVRHPTGEALGSDLAPGVEHLHFDDFNSVDCIAALQKLAPDLGVLAGTYILKESVFGIPRLGSLNLHSGKAPEYRGSAPAFWELFNGESVVGITIHRVTRELDAGMVLRQELFPLDPAPIGDPLDYVARFRREVLEPNAVRLMVETVIDLGAGRVTEAPQDATKAKTYGMPDHKAKTELRRRVARRRRDGVWKKQVKKLVGFFVFHSGLYRRSFRDRAVIVLFHRVDDRLKGNPISCTTREFAAFCSFFARFFEVITLNELLDRIERKASVARTLVITFDDGYRDNRTVAAPILQTKGLPACFFIATGFIESDKVPWWDAERGIKSEWMNWTQVRELKSMGFEIGAHTVNHVDLGVVHGNDAKIEIERCGEQLSSQLAEGVTLFSYPYGRPNQITPENREQVRRAGYRCCVSAYGGSVRPRNDPYELRREPISPWLISPYQFGCELLTKSS